MIDMYSDRFPFLLLSLGLLLAKILHGALGIKVKNSLNNSSPRLGDTITFECNIVIGTAKSVSWYKDKTGNISQIIYLTHNCSVFADKYKSRLKNVQCDTNNHDFQLSDVQISDRGKWLCEADGEEAKSPLKLDVLVPPLTPTVTNPSPMKVGDVGNFTCNAENENVTKPVTYTWTKNGNTVSPGTVEPGALLFSVVKKSDAGKYVCVAKNDAGSKESTEQDFVVHSSDTSDLSNSVPINTTASYTSDLSNSVSVNTKASYTSDLSNSVLANPEEATQSSKETNKNFKVGIDLIAVGGSLVVISIVIGIVIIVIKHKEMSSGKKRKDSPSTGLNGFSDDQESQDNVVTGQSALLGGQVNHAMRLSLPRSECDPNENHKVAKSKLRTPDVVSDTNQYAESAALHVPVGKNGSQKEVRPTLLRPTQPASPAKEHLYGNVKRKIQPQQKGGSGGVPKPIGVDGTVYAKLSFQPAKHDHPVRRTEEPSPYSTVDFSRKAPPLEEEEEVLVQYIT
ncbi:uncharacterized protein LOC135502230 [Lineus longissimus]|uniref:uncharacterized protein LOC135502230 n=1 Tax=Lineus longissimus TaxID=88925 RepID=UPI00315D81E2